MCVARAVAFTVHGGKNSGRYANSTQQIWSNCSTLALSSRILVNMPATALRSREREPATTTTSWT
jgi:hypothetical protein